MNLLDYVTALNLDLEVIYVYARRQWMARLPRVEIKEGGGGILSSVVGEGSTPEMALKALALKLRGKPLVINAMGPRRMEFDAPQLYYGS